jgi:hypothetical protein
MMKHSKSNWRRQIANRPILHNRVWDSLSGYYIRHIPLGYVKVCLILMRLLICMWYWFSRLILNIGNYRISIENKNIQESLWYVYRQALCIFIDAPENWLFFSLVITAHFCTYSHHTTLWVNITQPSGWSPFLLSKCFCPFLHFLKKRENLIYIA